MLMHNDIVFLCVIIEPIVDKFRIIRSHYHHRGVAAPTCLRPPLLTALLLPLDNVEEVDLFKFKYLGFLVVP